MWWENSGDYKRNTTLSRSPVKWYVWSRTLGTALYTSCLTSSQMMGLFDLVFWTNLAAPCSWRLPGVQIFPKTMPPCPLERAGTEFYWHAQPKLHQIAKHHTVYVYIQTRKCKCKARCKQSKANRSVCGLWSTRGRGRSMHFHPPENVWAVYVTINQFGSRVRHL